MNSYEYKPLAKHDDLVVQEIGDEILIYDLKTNKALCLNHISALVWKNCNGKNSISRLSDLASSQLKTLISNSLIEFTIEQLRLSGLLEESESNKTQFTNLSRREAVRRIGFAGVVALPIITALIAPTPANAASGCIPGVTFPVPPGGNPPNVFGNVVPFPIADSSTGCGQCQSLLTPQCCSGSITNFSCSPAFPAASYNCNALCA